MASQKLFQSLTDTTKQLSFDIDGISTATERVVDWPDRNVNIGDVGFKSEENIWSRLQRYPVETITFAPTISVNASTGSGERRVTLTGNVTNFTVTNLPEGAYLVVDVFQDATGGRTVAFTGVSGTAPAITAAPLSRTPVVFKGLSTGPAFVESSTGMIALPDGMIYVGNPSGSATAVVMSGHVTITNSGTTTVRSASETQSGIAELATKAEVLTGTDGTRVATPLSLSGLVMSTDVRQTYSESNVTIQRTLNATNETLQSLSNVVATLLGDLRAKGVIG